MPEPTAPAGGRPPFVSPYRHGFLRAAIAVPAVRVVDPAENARRTIDLARRAASDGALLVAFPELGLSAYTADDLFHQEVLLEATEEALDLLVSSTTDLGCILVVGLPLRVEGRLFNCAAVVERGRIAGLVPKSYLPTYREFYEKRQFAAARDAGVDEVTACGQRVPFGADLLFPVPTIENLILHVEICEDLWVPIPPSSEAALAGATVLVSLSASNALVAKADYRTLLCRSHSARCLAASLYTSAGWGESTTDMAWDGHALICENGDVVTESTRFGAEDQLIKADVDIDRLAADRMRMTSFTDAATDQRSRGRSWRRIPLNAPAPASTMRLARTIGRFPYVPSDPTRRDERCREVRNIQVQGLAGRLSATGIEKVVIGASGGLDSSLALTVATAAMDRLGLPRSNVVGALMPGFATSSRTAEDASSLVTALGATRIVMDIRPSAAQMLRDIEHPAAEGEPAYDVTYENVQAGERTSHLFRLANHRRALVVGTGDLSELAVGWCTYGVGDQMAHYDVNASVPKTLVRHILARSAATNEYGTEASEVLRSILSTVISPELVPGSSSTPDSNPVQKSEETVGPFELVDFFLYYILRFGYRPSRVAYLALEAWGDADAGTWPDFVAIDDRRAYDLPTITSWLEIFLTRFVENQFKRSALPNGPKVGSGGSLSPRGDWRAPSDASARLWLEELRRNVPCRSGDGMDRVRTGGAGS